MARHVKLEGAILAEVIQANREGREVILSEEQMTSLGHHKQPLLRVIRSFCVGCMGGNQAEVKRCTAVQCELYPYRMARNPYATHPGNVKAIHPASVANGDSEPEKPENDPA